jgi:putative ABC transport system permease protein
VRPIGSGNGGVPARRAVVRWACRMFRREWRQQILVLTLLTVAVAAAAGGASAVYNMVPSRDADFGTASYRLTFAGTDPAGLRAVVPAARNRFGTIDVIEHRSARVPGSVETVDIRAQDPDGPYGAVMLGLRAGRYPKGADEVALTDSVAKTLNVQVGSSLELDRRERTVVGLVENPADLHDEFALVAPSHTDPPASLTILVDASRDQVESFRDALTGDVNVQREPRGQTEKTTAAAGTLGLATVGLFLVGLIAAAGFAVIAQRRLRQLGMLAAIGATDRHLRLVMLANGALVGVIAAVVGTIAGVLGWIALAPHVEGVAGHRIDALDVPLWLIGSSMALAVVAATAAAWWPARAAARIPITLALSARPPRPKPAHRSAVAAVVLVVVGFVCLAIGIDTTHDRANPLLVIAGTVAIALGVLLISPFAIRALAAPAARLPIAARLALRDLARHQARAGAALAAISLGLGIPVAIVITATAAEYTAARNAGPGNLSNRQLLIRTYGSEPLIPLRSPAELQRLEEQTNRIAAVLDDPAVIPLDVAVDPNAQPELGSGGGGGLPADLLLEQVGERSYSGFMLYVATPALLERLGVDPTSINPSADVITSRTQHLFLMDFSGRTRPAPVTNIQRIDSPTYSSLPNSFISEDALHRHGWQAARAGWLFEANRPLTAAQLASARELAAEADLTIEARQGGTSFAGLRAGATAAAMLLALGVLAMTVGLIRSEAGRDLRTLTASGATSTIRRTLTATTAGALALLGVVLGAAGAYLALIAGYLGDLSALRRVPVVPLAVLAVGLPVIASLAGWLLAGRDPPSLAYQPME